MQTISTLTPRRNSLTAIVVALLMALSTLVAADDAGAAKAQQLDQSTAGASVIGGYFPNAQWPWMAGLLERSRSGNDYQRHNCGGTLVHPRLVVTAAHCVVDSSNRARHPSNFEIVLGKRRLSLPGGEHIAVSHVQVHPNYTQPRRFSHDIALLYLASPSRQTPAALGSPATTLYQGNSVTAMGWGLVEGGGDYATRHADDVKAVDIGVWSDASCAGANATYATGYDPNTMICAGWANMQDNVCNGDSGGPLMYQDIYGTWRLIGVTSWVTRNCPGGATPGVWAWLGSSSIYSMIVNGINTASRMGSGYTAQAPQRAQAPSIRLTKASLSRFVVRRGKALRIKYRSSSAGTLQMQLTRRGRSIGAAWQASTRAGGNKVTLPARNRGRALRRGGYGVTLQVVQGGLRSNPVRLVFRIR